MSQRITVAHGDGIGPEIMPVVLDILRQGGADFKETSLNWVKKFISKDTLQALNLRTGILFVKQKFS